MIIFGDSQNLFGTTQVGENFNSVSKINAVLFTVSVSGKVVNKVLQVVSLGREISLIF